MTGLFPKPPSTIAAARITVRHMRLGIQGHLAFVGLFKGTRCAKGTRYASQAISWKLVLISRRTAWRMGWDGAIKSQNLSLTTVQ